MEADMYTGTTWSAPRNMGRIVSASEFSAADGHWASTTAKGPCQYDGQTLYPDNIYGCKVWGNQLVVTVATRLVRHINGAAVATYVPQGNANIWTLNDGYIGYGYFGPSSRVIGPGGKDISVIVTPWQQEGVPYVVLVDEVPWVFTGAEPPDSQPVVYARPLGDTRVITIPGYSSHMHVRLVGDRFIVAGNGSKGELTVFEVAVDEPRHAIPTPVAVFPPLNRKAAVFGFFVTSDRPHVKDDPKAFPQNCTWVESEKEMKRAVVDVICDSSKMLEAALASSKCYALWLSRPTLAEAEAATAALKKKVKGRKPILSYVDSTTPPTRKPRSIKNLGLAIYPKKSGETAQVLVDRWSPYIAALPRDVNVVLIGRASRQFNADTPYQVEAYASAATRLAAKHPNVISIGWFSDEPSRGVRHPDLDPVLRPALAEWFRSVKGRP
jgi:hypothetical protein